MKRLVTIMCILGVFSLSHEARAEHAAFSDTGDALTSVADLPEGGTEISVDTPDVTVATAAAPGERFSVRTKRGLFGLGILPIEKTQIRKEDGTAIDVVTTPRGTRVRSNVPLATW